MRNRIALAIVMALSLSACGGDLVDPTLCPEGFIPTESGQCLPPWPPADPELKTEPPASEAACPSCPTRAKTALQEMAAHTRRTETSTGRPAVELSFAPPSLAGIDIAALLDALHEETARLAPFFGGGEDGTSAKGILFSSEPFVRFLDPEGRLVAGAHLRLHAGLLDHGLYGIVSAAPVGADEPGWTDPEPFVIANRPTPQPELPQGVRTLVYEGTFVGVDTRPGTMQGDAVTGKVEFTIELFGTEGTPHRATLELTELRYRTGTPFRPHDLLNNEPLRLHYETSVLSSPVQGRNPDAAHIQAAWRWVLFSGPGEPDDVRAFAQAAGTLDDWSPSHQVRGAWGGTLREDEDQPPSDPLIPPTIVPGTCSEGCLERVWAALEEMAAHTRRTETPTGESAVELSFAPPSFARVDIAVLLDALKAAALTPFLDGSDGTGAKGILFSSDRFLVPFLDEEGVIAAGTDLRLYAGLLDHGLYGIVSAAPIDEPVWSTPEPFVITNRPTPEPEFPPVARRLSYQGTFVGVDTRPGEMFGHAVTGTVRFTIELFGSEGVADRARLELENLWDRTGNVPFRLPELSYETSVLSSPVRGRNPDAAHVQAAWTWVLFSAGPVSGPGDSDVRAFAQAAGTLDDWSPSRQVRGAWGGTLQEDEPGIWPPFPCGPDKVWDFSIERCLDRRHPVDIVPSGARPAPGTATYHPVSEERPAGRYAYTGTREDEDAAIHIGIEDSPVNFTDPHFHGRVQLEGAAFSYWRPLADQPLQRAFAACSAAEPCRVFHVESGGSRVKLEALARTVLEHEGIPDGNNRWFLYDESEKSKGGFGWSELPGADDYQHGTLVASVAAGGRFHPFPSTDTVIVPMARNFDEQNEVRHYLSDLVSEADDDPERIAERDREHAAKLKAQHYATDLINASYGVSVDLNSSLGRNTLGVWKADLIELKHQAPMSWGEFTGTDTLRVWAAGNHTPGTGVPPSVLPDDPYEEFPNVLAGDGHRNLNALGPYYFKELRGTHLSVTALSPDEERLAPYADPCGSLPENWDPRQHGRHFCLAAPVPAGLAGTSFAAPFVSGVLARMMSHFPGVSPSDLVRKLMDTADDRFENGFDGDIYVAEIVDFDRDERPIFFGDGFDGSGTLVYTVDRHEYEPGPAVLQRGCRLPGDGADYLVSTGEPGDMCLIWHDPYEPGETEPQGRQRAEQRAKERFRYLYGAGRVNVERALAPSGGTTITTTGGYSAPVSSTLMRPAAAYGALGDRLAGHSLVAFDAMSFPFSYRMDDFITYEEFGPSPIPDFLPEPLPDPPDCRSLRALAPDLACSPGEEGSPWQALVSPDGLGAAFRPRSGVRLAGFQRFEGRLDAAGSGALSLDGGSSLAALRLSRAFPTGASGRWRVDGSLTLAADLPSQLWVEQPSIFDAGPTLLTDWSIGITRGTSDAGRTRLALSQPARAETGHARLTVPSGRIEDGTRLYRNDRVSLVPSHRELTLQLAHQRPFGRGELVLGVHRTENPGHRSGDPQHGVGFAFHRTW